MFSVLVIRLRSLRLLRVSGIVMRLRMFLLLITFLKASHSFRNRLLVICKNAYLFATMIMRSEERRVGKECSYEMAVARGQNKDRPENCRDYFHRSHSHITKSILPIFFFKQKTAYEVGLGIPAEPLFRSYAPSYVSPAYHLLEGFPFIQEPPSGDLQERVLIRHHDYDQCFQSVQLLQWNSQVKFNVTV